MFKHLLFVRLEYDQGLETDYKHNRVHLGQDHLLVTKLGEYGLGDRWSGELKLIGNEVRVGKDEGWFDKMYPKKGCVVKIDM